MPKDTGGIVEAIRQLSVARGGALKARTAALQQLDDLIITAPEGLRATLAPQYGHMSMVVVLSALAVIDAGLIVAGLNLFNRKAVS